MWSLGQSVGKGAHPANGGGSEEICGAYPRSNEVELERGADPLLTGV